MFSRLIARAAARWVLLAGCIAGAALLPPRPAHAHPHVFIEARTMVLYDNGTFTGVQHRWTFDEFYTATAIEGLDTNKDGVYDRQELAELAKVNIEGLKEFGYFTFPTLAGKEVKLGEVKEYWLEYKDGALTLVFTLPFAQPILTDAKGFRLGVADPTFFIGFEWAKTNAVTLGEGAPKSCKITLGSPTADPGKSPGSSEELALQGVLSQQFGGGVVSAERTVGIACGPQ